MSARPSQRRFWWTIGCFVAAFAVLAGRLVQLQVIAPRQPSEHSADNTEYRVIRSGRRGSIVDAHGVPLVLSRYSVTVRADPLKLGPFSSEMARLAAPILGISESEFLARLHPVPVGPMTNGAERIRRNLGIATNIPLETWESLAQLLQTNRFSGDLRLALELTNTIHAVAVQKKQIPWWDIVRRREVSRTAVSHLQELRSRYKVVHSNSVECLANGLYPEVFEMRVYPREALASHVLGFTTNGTPPPGADLRTPLPVHGAAGLEQRFDAELQGAAGILESHRFGNRELVPLRQRAMAASEGLNIVLNLDANIQGMVEEALDFGEETLHPKALSIIVVRPRDGAVLALGNRPTFNPNSRHFPSLDALQNRAIMAPAEPGSTFKLVTYSAALEEGLVTLDSSINCEHGHWLPPGIRYPVHDDQGDHQDLTTVIEAFAHSSNVGASKLGLALGTNRFRDYIYRFGYLARTGIECGEEGVFTKYIKGRPTQLAFHGEAGGGVVRWDAIAASRLPYGYGLFATPLQTCMSAAAIANQGVLMAPQLVRRLETSDGRIVREFKPVAVRRVIKPSTAEAMTKAMRQVVLGGTGKSAALDDYEVCGKTGTSKKVDPATHAYSSTLYYSSFVGFFPVDAPEICMMINADQPAAVGKAYYGGKACAPIFKKLAVGIAAYLALPPSVAHTNQAGLYPLPELDSAIQLTETRPPSAQPLFHP